MPGQPPYAAAPQAGLGSLWRAHHLGLLLLPAHRLLLLLAYWLLLLLASLSCLPEPGPLACFCAHSSGQEEGWVIELD